MHTDFDEGSITGLDGAPIRKQVDLAGQADGGTVQPAFFAPRVITFAGQVLIRSVAWGDSLIYAAAVNAVEASAISALEGFLNSTTTLAWTPIGGSAKSITVTYGTEGGEIEFFGNVLHKRFSFSLIAENPLIS